MLHWNCAPPPARQSLLRSSSYQGWSGVSTAIDPLSRSIELVEIACRCDFEDRTAGLRGDGLTVAAGRQPRQMMMALPSRVFSRVHHSVLVGRGSGGSSF